MEEGKDEHGPSAAMRGWKRNPGKGNVLTKAVGSKGMGVPKRKLQKMESDLVSRHPDNEELAKRYTKSRGGKGGWKRKAKGAGKAGWEDKRLMGNLINAQKKMGEDPSNNIKRARGMKKTDKSRGAKGVSPANMAKSNVMSKEARTKQERKARLKPKGSPHGATDENSTPTAKINAMMGAAGKLYKAIDYLTARTVEDHKQAWITDRVRTANRITEREVMAGKIPLQGARERAKFWYDQKNDDGTPKDISVALEAYRRPLAASGPPDYVQLESTLLTQNRINALGGRGRAWH